MAQAKGAFVQSASDRRPLARVLLTVLGALMMIIGAFRPWTSDPLGRGDQWNVSNIASVMNLDASPVEEALNGAGLLGTANMLVNAGSVVIMFAVVALFGLTGRSGRLTRAAALLCLVLVVAFLFALNLGPLGAVAVSGHVAWVVLGCVAAFTGGLLAKR